jgi:hypothetical protein
MDLDTFPHLVDDDMFKKIVALQELQFRLQELLCLQEKVQK